MGAGAMSRAAAEGLALRVLDWLAADPERIERLFAQSGADPSALRESLVRPEGLGFLLDHLLADEALLLACAGDLGIPPEAPLAARAALPGGDAPHWT